MSAEWEEFGWRAANVVPAIVALAAASVSDLILAVLIGLDAPLGVLPPAGTFIVTAIVFALEAALITSILFGVAGRSYRRVRRLSVKVGILAVVLIPTAFLAAYGVLGVWVAIVLLAGNPVDWDGFFWQLHPLNYLAVALPLAIYVAITGMRLRASRLPRS